MVHVELDTDPDHTTNATVLAPYVIISNPDSVSGHHNVTNQPVFVSSFGPPVTVEDDVFDEKTFRYQYVLVPLGALFFIAVFTFVVIMVLRKSKMDKLRHHLMPLYNFDPAEEEEGDWENELLEEDKEQQVALNYNARGPMCGPQLKFHHMDRIV